jgi:hypothetical protein
MDDMNLYFSDNNEIIIDALIHKLKAKIDQFEELVDHYNEERSFRIELEGQVADLKKAAKAPKAPDLPIVKSVKMIRGDLPKVTKKAIVAPAKRKPGRPKKVVA